MHNVLIYIDLYEILTFIANCDLLWDENHLIKDLNLKFDLDDPLLFSKIRKELITINRVERI